MDIKRIKIPLDQFLKKMPKSIQVDQVIIFGSYLEGTATKDSDIDVLIISEDFRNLNEDQRLDILYEARGFSEPIIDPWGFTHKELSDASKLTTLGYARDQGIHFFSLP